MDNNKLKTIVETARTTQGYTQRELSKKIVLSESTYNDTINGKIKKIDINILRKIAEGLDLSLEELLDASGYGEITSWLSNDEYQNKSTRDLKNIIKEARAFKYDILDWDAKKRNEAMNIMRELGTMKLNLKLLKENSKRDYTLDNAINDIDNIVKELENIAKKYDYSKLPKDL